MRLLQKFAVGEFVVKEGIYFFTGLSMAFFKK
jgi:hypothetical protein